MLEVITKKDFNLIRFPNGEFKLVALRMLEGTIMKWKADETFANGEKTNSPSEELVALFQLDKIAEQYKSEGQYHEVYVDYLPFKRQDKIKIFGEIKFNDVYDCLTTLKLKEFAPHDSERFEISTLSIYLNALAPDYVEVIVFPDTGAQSRFSELKLITEIPIVSFDKIRDKDTGKLTFKPLEDKVKESIKGKTVAIFDDIIAYGGTFKHVAKELKDAGAKKVTLVVNHSDGVMDEEDIKANGVDEVIILNGGL